MHSFVEFDNPASVKRARNLRLEGVLVKSMTPALLEEYNSLVQDASKSVSSLPTKSIASSSSGPVRGSPHRRCPAPLTVPADAEMRSITNAQNKKTSRRVRRSEAGSSELPPSAQLPTPGASFSLSDLCSGDTAKGEKSSLQNRIYGQAGKENIEIAQQKGETAVEDELQLPLTPVSIPRVTIPLPRHALVPTPASVPTSSKRHSRTQPNPARNPTQTPATLTLTSGPSFTLQTVLVMSLSNENITYDLDTLESDPKGIISLLKLTASERDKWMMVACHYRKNGQFEAAIQVVHAMVEGLFRFASRSLFIVFLLKGFGFGIITVIKEYGLSEGEIKPAFLMLSSCESALSKRTRTVSGQKTAVSEAHFRRSHAWLHKVYGVKDSEEPQNTNALGLELSSEAAASSSAKIPLAPSSPAVPTSPSHLNKLQRELQILRARDIEITDKLNNVSAAKRQLQRDVEAERCVRRRLERRLDEVEQEVVGAQKMEGYALDQVKREVEARRRAEERAEIERERRMDAELDLSRARRLSY